MIARSIRATTWLPRFFVSRLLRNGGPVRKRITNDGPASRRSFYFPSRETVYTASQQRCLGSMDLASGQSRGLLHFLPSKLSPRGVVRAFTSASRLRSLALSTRSRLRCTNLPSFESFLFSSLVLLSFRFFSPSFLSLFIIVETMTIIRIIIRAWLRYFSIVINAIKCI